MDAGRRGGSFTPVLVTGAVGVAASVVGTLLLLHRPEAGSYSPADMIVLTAAELMHLLGLEDPYWSLRRDGTGQLIGALVILTCILPMLAVMMPGRARRKRSRRRRRSSRGQPRGAHGEKSRAPDRSRARDAGSTSPSSAGPAARRAVPGAPAFVAFSGPQLASESGIAGTPVHRTIGELQVLADAAGLPWREEYATPGGARAMLELIRLRTSEGDVVLSAADGTAARVAASEAAASSPAPQVREHPGPEVPGVAASAAAAATAAALPDLDGILAEQDEPEATAPSESIGQEDRGTAAPTARSGQEDPETSVPAAPVELGGAGSASDAPSEDWAAGSVYTSTSLYTPTSLTGPAPDDEAAEPSADDPEAEPGEGR